MPCGVGWMITLVGHAVDTYNVDKPFPTNRTANGHPAKVESLISTTKPSCMEFYYNAHRDRCINPTFMPMTRRWSWTTFRDLHKQDPNVIYNFPKFNLALMATSKGLAQQLREWNQ